MIGHSWGMRNLMVGRRVANIVPALLIVSAVPQALAQTAAAKERNFVIEMRGSPFRFVPDLLQVDPGDVVTIIVFNNDTTPHTFDLDRYNVHLGTVAAPMQPGTNRTATLTASTEGTFWFFCSVPGHATQRGDGSYQGMAGRLIVGRPTAGPDLTVVLAVGGVIALAGGVVGFLVLRRRRALKP